MVAEIKQSTQAGAQPSVEDEATKRNTDCVYFLASPLTCKKGRECEYRHSEYARVNPRDCWYWLNGTCLNPKCAFRHPPLDGLLGTQSDVSNGNALPLQQAVAPSPVAGSQSKQVPCIFFHKGLCVKGDKCTYLHGPNHGATKPPQVTPPAAEVAGLKGMFGVPQRSAQGPEVYQPNASNIFKYTDSNSTSKICNSLLKPKAVAERVVLQSGGFNDESSSYNSNKISPLPRHSNIQLRQLEAADDHMMHNDKDADDSHRESSPGFDVLVDDELSEDHYYDEEQYGITRGDIGGRNADYFGTLSDANHGMFHDPQSYNGYDRIRGPKDQSRRSSERISRCPGISDSIGQSDLRYRLEQKKGSSLRLGNCKDNARVNHEGRLLSPLVSSLNSRLHGRIQDRRRSPLRVRGSGSDRDTERGRNPSRTSPRPIHIRDRIGVRVHDDFRNERNSRGYGMIKERLVDVRSECSGSSDIKGNISVKDRLMSGQESFSLGKRKNTQGHGKFDSDLSFDGPKSLSEILKRKKKSEMNKTTGNNNSNANEKTDIYQEPKPDDTHVFEEKTGLDQTQTSEVTNTDQVDRITADEGMGDQNLEGYGLGEDGEEEYYYEEDGGEYTVEEAENVEGEYADAGNGDEFEKRIEGMFS